MYWLWFQRQDRRDKIATAAAIAVLATMVWLAAASAVLIVTPVFPALMRSYYTWTNPETYWQWLDVATDPGQPQWVNKWLWLSALFPTGLMVLFAVRNVLDVMGAKNISSRKRPLYGETHSATRTEMVLGGLNFRRRKK